MDKFDEVNQAADGANARQRRNAWLRARWRAHPVWFTIIAVPVLYAFCLGIVELKPPHPRGASLFLWAGIVMVAGVALSLLRRWWRRHATPRI